MDSDSENEYQSKEEEMPTRCKTTNKQ